MRPIQDIVSSLGFTPRTLIEVGAACGESYRLDHYVKGGFKVVLVEANPRLYHCLAKGYPQGAFRQTWPQTTPPPYLYPAVTGSNLQIVHAAVADHNGTIKLYERDASTFVGGVNSPARQNDGYSEREKDAYEVPAVTIDRLDDGQVDVLLADCEGSEWFCLKGLISRPRLIVLELKGGGYRNPFRAEIDAWMTENGYRQVEDDQTDVAFTRAA